jgi:peptidoglycan/xylan/chitin deacetylase (PgdA/CDA1 family)
MGDAMTDGAETTPIWPAGHRAALCLTFDVDGHYGEANYRKPDETYWLSQTAYDPVGSVRILDILADTGVPATFCWVGRAAEDRPDLVERAVAEGHEIALHSWDHRYYNRMSDEEQRADMLRTFETLTRISKATPTGHKTAGWRFTEFTHRLAQELGLDWVMDIPTGDLPALMQPDELRPPLVQLPPSWLYDDYSFFVDRTVTPQQTFEFWRDDLDVLRAEGKLMCLTMHPFVSGRPGPSRAFSRLIDHAIDAGDVWIARADHIARWWLERHTDDGAAADA